VAAYLFLAERMRDLALAGQAFNFGTSEPKSVLEMVALILAAAGRPELEPVVLDQATNEIEKQYLDCTKARRVLGWEPAFTLQDALARTVRWYREHEARA
jgi:CDP-glucose 4,6-dehydratase